MLSFAKTILIKGLFFVLGSVIIGLVSISALALLSNGVGWADWWKSILSMLLLGGIALIPVIIFSFLLGLVKGLGGMFTQ